MMSRANMLRYTKNKKRMELLNLYLMVNELNKLMKEGKHDEALNVYIKIKSEGWLNVQ